MIIFTVMILQDLSKDSNHTDELWFAYMYVKVKHVGA
jgi:hypothetical protein